MKDDKFKGFKLIIGDNGFRIEEDKQPDNEPPREEVDAAEAKLRANWDEYQRVVRDAILHAICFLRGRLDLTDVLMNASVMLFVEPGVGIEITANTYDASSATWTKDYPELGGPDEPGNTH